MIDISNLSVSFDHGLVEVLTAASVVAPDRSYVSLTGVSGSGKSTILNVIGGLLRPTSGRVIVDGVDLACTSRRRLASYRARAVGFVFQSSHMLNMTARRNVAMGGRYRNMSATEAASEADRLLTRVGLSGRENHRPWQLSGGERQRVAIARALVGEPLIVLADEPTGNLDPGNADQSMALLEETCQEIGATLLVATHTSEIAERAAIRWHLAHGTIEG